MNIINVNPNLIDEMPSRGGLAYENANIKTFRLENFAEIEVTTFGIQNWDEPGDFYKVSLSSDDASIGEFSNLNGWETGNTRSRIKELINNHSLVENDRFIVLDMGSNHYVLVLFGYPYASIPPFLTIISFAANESNVVFNKNFELQEIMSEDKLYIRGIYKENLHQIFLEQGQLIFQPE
ncbi:hypothetical protein SAMN04488029_3522 [Reichenbachiella faecimaris]|uniref:Uncharacterized protein n=1 Tax=Reichenbachiella faecimaris TaxID=692418 RepID=A0A1W2GML1_REIFA|nr:hypothetical protein [Reichenbachiella faecimaris]SMD37887.1 hypothetical protein SAMN04488029_3522 [Reichenbachiella faecimaris]